MKSKNTVLYATASSTCRRRIFTNRPRKVNIWAFNVKYYSNLTFFFNWLTRVKGTQGYGLDKNKCVLKQFEIIPRCTYKFGGINKKN